MSKFIVVICLILFAIRVASQDVRTAYQLKDYEWLLLDNASGEFESIKKYKNLPSGSKLLCQIEFDNIEASLIALSFFDWNNICEVFINDELVLNELNGDNFHAEITPFIESEEIEIQLVLKNDLSAEMFSSLVNSTKIDHLKSVFLCHLTVNEDSFLGGKLLEVAVKNRLDNDIDGKIYGRLYNIETMKLVAENNNCAFIRSGNDALIEINFPESSVDLKGKKWLAEIRMVDKENNEELIDQLSVPVRF